MPPGPGLNRWPAWHAWLFSFLAFNVGFFIYVSLGVDIKSKLHANADLNNLVFHYLRLVPIWMMITFLFVQTYLKQGLHNALQQVTSINAQLPLFEPTSIPAENRTCIELGLPELNNVRLTAISHVTVDDHYCHIYYLDSDTWRKSIIWRSLTELVKLLPDDFMQVHRSHTVNPRHVVKLTRQGRTVILNMHNGDAIPISRSKRNEVLPQLDLSS